MYHHAGDDPSQSGPESDRGHHGGGFGDGAGYPPATGSTRHPDMNGTEIKSGLGPLGRWYLRGLRRSTRGDATFKRGSVPGTPFTDQFGGIVNTFASKGLGPGSTRPSFSSK